MTTTASLPTPAHQLCNPTPISNNTTSSDVNYQGLPVPRGPVTASLSFYKAPEDGAPPHNYVEPLPGVPQRNWGDAWTEVELNDLRGQEHKFTLDNNAFDTYQNIKSGLDRDGFEDDDAIKRVYYPEVENLLLKNVQGAQRVLLFDHTIRRPTGNRNPVQRVHIDQTPSSAAERVKLHLPDEAEQLLKVVTASSTFGVHSTDLSWAAHLQSPIVKQCAMVIWYPSSIAIPIATARPQL